MGNNSWARRKAFARVASVRSPTLEGPIKDQIEDRGLDAQFEAHKLKYTVPESTHTYTPDFTIPKNWGNEVIRIEAKGLFSPEDRKKMLNVRKSNPSEDIRFVFQRAKSPIRKNSKTTYGDWATKNGFLWSEKLIPDEWFFEERSPY